MARSHRTTITVPNELKARMDAIGEDVNWSALACRAFEQKLGEIINRRGVKGMQGVIARLRASKLEHASEAFGDGIAAGKEWAGATAEAVELERLERYREDIGSAWDEVFAAGFGGAIGIHERLAWTARPDDERDREAASRFWEQAIGDNFESLMCDDDFLKGFVDGALEVWDAVKDQL
jgi:hypothetical protein